MNTLIIGGGAAGMAAALAAAKRGERATVLERGRRPMRKLAVTGNGRGNLLNAEEPVYLGGEAFALAALERMPYARLCAFFDWLGVPLTQEDGGRVYPAALLASVAVDALALRARELGVRVETNTRVTSLKREGNGFRVEGVRAVYAPDVTLKSGRVKPGAAIGEEAFRASADRVIVAAGGAASPAHGTDGTAYALLEGFGHRLIAPRPALCALTAPESAVRGLAGQRARARLRLLDGAGAALAESRGEALFAQDGVSGIAAMQLSREVRPGCVLEMDLREAVMGAPQCDMDAEAWVAARAAAFAGRPLRELLTGAVSPALNAALLRAAGMSADAELPAERVSALASRLGRAIQAYRVPITGTRGFDAAQVTAGGIAVEDFDPATMESRLCAGLYAAGEVLDVDGGCGGYNLMFAFASGLIAGGAGR